ncbi:MAG: phosphoribosylanthranilate isomerase, partial [Chthoniobacterales bacterium]
MPEEAKDPVLVKVCGLTTALEALFCAAAGVDMLGLNFSPQSKRRISPEHAREMIRKTRREFPQAKFIGLFVDQPTEFVNELVRTLALDGVQLHGAESPDYLRSVRTAFVIKALRVGPDFAADAIASYPCDSILLDSWSANAPGGTGETFDWSIAAGLSLGERRLMLAGGLTAENVGAAIELVRPFAVDVCSGVEDAPGRKNEMKARRFLEAVRAT